MKPEIYELVKIESLEAMRHMTPCEKYPADRYRLTPNESAPCDSLGRLAIPRGSWYVPGKAQAEITPQMRSEFAGLGYRLGADDLPLHPWIDDMIKPDIGVVTGSGELWYWGANLTADPGPIRIDQKEPLMLLIQRLNGQWAFAGGYVEPGESTYDAALRECHEETLLDISGSVMSAQEVYRGPVADPRATANAWQSTAGYLLLLDPEKTHDMPTDTFRGNPDEVLQAGWFPRQFATHNLYGSHSTLARLMFDAL